MLGVNKPGLCLFWFGRDVMSSFANSSLAQQQSCFCCSPAKVPNSLIESNSHHDPIVMSSMQVNSLKPFPDPHSPHVDEGAISDMIPRVHLENQGGCGSSNDSSSISSEPPSIDSIQGLFGNLKINMKALHARQLGMGFNNTRKTNTISNNMVQGSSNWFTPEMESQLSTSLPVSNANMDLDLALDELGMLSTVTNSRKQYLSETRSQTAVPRQERKLHKKSESSPNLASLSRMNGYRVIQLDSNYVTNVSCDKPPNPLHPSVPFCETSPVLSDSSMLQYRDPQIIEANAAAARRRSVPRISRLRKDRYSRYRCPYKVPNRLYNSMQEGDFGPDYFRTCSRVFNPMASSPIVTSNSEKKSFSKYQTKSNGTSPAKGHQDQHIARSHSVEDLISVQRRLELLFDESNSKETEVHLDQVATQFYGLHMS